jgi:hypothetical protein
MQLRCLWSKLVHLPSLLCLVSLVPIYHSLADAYVDFPKLVLCTVYICPVLTDKDLCIFYCSWWKSIDLINLEKACEYFATKSLLVVGQVPPLIFSRCMWTYVLLWTGRRCIRSAAHTVAVQPISVVQSLQLRVVHPLGTGRPSMLCRELIYFVAVRKKLGAAAFSCFCKLVIWSSIWVALLNVSGRQKN